MRPSERATLAQSDNVLAADFVVGALNESVTERLRARIQNDPEFAALVDLWEAHLSMQSDEFAASDLGMPKRSFWQRAILDKLDNPKVQSARELFEKYKLPLSAVLAVALIVSSIYYATGMTTGPAPISFAKADYVAHIESQKEGTNFFAFYDEETGSLGAFQLEGERPQERDYELWLILPNVRPMPVGLIHARSADERPALTEMQRGMLEKGAEFAVSNEPLGGAPSLRPTGPYVARGKIVPVS